MSDYESAHIDLFGDKFPKKMIEFGLGAGTEFFLKRCEKVVSVELYTSDKLLAKELPISSDHWMKHFKKEFKKYDNWEINGYKVKKAIIQAEKEVTGKAGLPRGSDPISLGYKEELRKLIQTLFKNRYFDYAFVDAGIHLRGDIVNLLFNKVPIISAHDFNDVERVYGYHRIRVPAGYEVQDGALCGEGIRFWVKK